MAEDVRRLRWRRLAPKARSGNLFVLGITGLWVLLVGVPLVGLVLYSILHVERFQVTLEPTLDSYLDLLRSGRWQVVLRTLRIAAVVTLIELLLAFPFAFWLAKRLKSVPVKVAILTLTLVPFFLSSAARAIVWRPILNTTGLVNTLLVETGLTDAPIDWLLFSEFAVHFGLIPPFFPTMLFPLFLSITFIDEEYLSASSDLGATPLQMLWTVILPLAAPGIMAGLVFTIVPILGELAIPQLLGGGNVNLLGKSVEGALQALNYGTAAAMCTLVLAVLALLLLLLRWIAARSGMLAAGFGMLSR